jgi:hypothetical protein
MLGVLCASAVLAIGINQPVFAQGEGGGGMLYGGGSYGATFLRAGTPPRKAGTAEACPGVMWDITRTPGAQKGSYDLSGPVWYTDGSGMSLAKGELRPDRTFTLNVTSMGGKGPAGTVTGTLNRDGSRDVKMTGSGTCNNMEMHLKAGQTSTKS